MKIKKQYLRHGITVFVLMLFAWYLWSNKESFNQLVDLSLPPLLGMFVFKLFRMYNTGQFIRSILRACKTPISRMEGFYVALISAIGNYFGPYLGGASARAVYMKKKHGLSYTDFATTLSGHYLITFRVYSFLGLLALIAIQIQSGEYSWLLYGVIFSWLVMTILFFRSRKFTSLIFQKEFKNRIINKITNKLQKVVVGLDEIKKDKALFFDLNKLTVYNFLITFVVVNFQFLVIGAEVTIPSAMLYVVLTNLSLLLSITPGAIGIREAIFIFSGNLLGLSTEQILLLAIITRTMTFLVMLVSYLFVRLQGSYSYIKSNS